MFHSELTPPSNEMLLGRFCLLFFKVKNQIASASKIKKKGKVLIRLYWNSLALHPGADFSQLLTHPPFSAPAWLLKLGTLGADAASMMCVRESVGEKTSLLASFVLFPGQDKKRNTPLVPTPFPPPGGLEPLRTPGQARLGPEVSAGPRPPVCPEA